MVNGWTLNGRTSTGYGTGDVHGPTLVWAGATVPTGTWTKATEPAAATWAKVIA